MNLKLHRCHDYRAELTKAVQSFTGETGHGLEVRSNDVMTEWQLVPRFASHPDTDGWAIIFGDYVHCLRSALDHLVYAFATASAAPNPPLRQRSVMMPLKTSPGEYKRVLWRLEDLDDITCARIESLQPYDDRPTHKLLWMLEELDVRDKHRLISIVPLYPASMIIRLEGLEPGTTMTGPTPPTRMRAGEPFTG